MTKCKACQEAEGHRNTLHFARRSAQTEADHMNLKYMEFTLTALINHLKKYHCTCNQE